MVAEFRQSLRQEPRHGFTCLGQDLAVGDETACLQEKTKSSGTSAAHLAKVSGFWLL